MILSSESKTDSKNDSIVVKDSMSKASSSMTDSKYSLENLYEEVSNLSVKKIEIDETNN